MTSIYVDTNVIIARYKPNDPLYQYAEKLLVRDDLSFYISQLTIVELCAVLSRIIDEIDVGDQTPINLDTLISFIIEDCKLKITAETYSTVMKIAGQEIRIPVEYYVAYRNAERLKLRTLDLLHLAHVTTLKKAYGIQTFITGDEELIEKAEVIKEALNVNIVHPKEASSRFIS